MHCEQSKSIPVDAQQEAEKTLRETRIYLHQAQKMEIVGNLAGSLAHDFNNILGSIMGTVSLMQYDLEQEEINRDSMRGHIKLIEDAADRAGEMVRQLLVLSCHRPVSRRRFNLVQTLQRVLDVCRTTFGKKIRVSACEGSGEAFFEGDSAQIEHALLNLCVNALHAMTIMREREEEHGGRLTLRLDLFQADERFREKHPDARGEAFWKISVQDTGVGLTDPMIERIFDPFFTTKTAGDGTGLGLAIVYTIVREHGGAIEVVSTPGAGATFSIFLPQSD